MKLRKHKNNKSFLITSTTRSPARTESHLNSDGSARKVVIEGLTRTERVFATGSCKQSVIRAFLFGRDVSHIVMADIREASPLLWGGRLVVSEFNGVPTTICPA